MKRWYIIQVRSGYEAKAISAIKIKLDKHGLSEMVEDIRAPSVKVSVVQKGQVIEQEKSLMPGYIFIKMDLNYQVQNILKVPSVTRLLGSKNAAQPISDKEVERVFSSMESEAKSVSVASLYQIGEQVIVIDGAFLDFVGTIEEVNIERQSLKVSISVFGQPTPVTFTFGQVKKT